MNPDPSCRAGCIRLRRHGCSRPPPVPRQRLSAVAAARAGSAPSSKAIVSPSSPELRVDPRRRRAVLPAASPHGRDRCCSIRRRPCWAFQPGGRSPPGGGRPRKGSRPAVVLEQDNALGRRLAAMAQMGGAADHGAAVLADGSRPWRSAPAGGGCAGRHRRSRAIGTSPRSTSALRSRSKCMAKGISMSWPASTAFFASAQAEDEVGDDEARESAIHCFRMRVSRSRLSGRDQSPLMPL